MLGSLPGRVRKRKRAILLALAILVSVAAAAIVANNGPDDVPKGSTVGATTTTNSENTAPGTNDSPPGDLPTDQTALTAPDPSTPLGTGFTVTQDTFPPQDLSNLLAVNTSDFDTPNIPFGFDAPGPQDGNFSPQTSFADSLLSPPTSTFSSGGTSGGTSGGSNSGSPTDPPATSNSSSEQNVSFDEQLTTPPCVETTDPEKCNTTEGTVPGGNGEQSSLSVTAVPEPSSLFWVAFVFAGLGALIRRRLCC